MKNFTTTLNSAASTLYIVTEQALRILSVLAYAYVLTFACILRACIVVYAVGEYFGEWYYQRGGAELIAKELEPCAQAVRTTYAIAKPIAIRYVVPAIAAAVRKVEAKATELLVVRLPKVVTHAVTKAVITA